MTPTTPTGTLRAKLSRGCSLGQQAAERLRRQRRGLVQLLRSDVCFEAGLGRNRAGLANDPPMQLVEVGHHDVAGAAQDRRPLLERSRGPRSLRFRGAERRPSRCRSRSLRRLSRVSRRWLARRRHARRRGLPASRRSRPFPTTGIHPADPSPSPRNTDRRQYCCHPIVRHENERSDAELNLRFWHRRQRAVSLTAHRASVTVRFEHESTHDERQRGLARRHGCNGQRRALAGETTTNG